MNFLDTYAFRVRFSYILEKKPINICSRQLQSAQKTLKALPSKTNETRTRMWTIFFCTKKSQSYLLDTKSFGVSNPLFWTDFAHLGVKSGVIGCSGSNGGGFMQLGRTVWTGEGSKVGSEFFLKEDLHAVVPKKRWQIHEKYKMVRHNYWQLLCFDYLTFYVVSQYINCEVDKFLDV